MSGSSKPERRRRLHGVPLRGRHCAGPNAAPERAALLAPGFRQRMPAASGRASGCARAVYTAFASFAMSPNPAPGASSAPWALDVFIISWQDHGQKALHIAQRIAERFPQGEAMADGVRLTVIYSNADEAPESGPGRWLQVPNADYFGAKFARALAEFDGRALLLIQADAGSDDWPGLIERCRQRFAQRAALALWAPRVSYTPWSPARVDIRPEPGAALTHVAHTDGIVLAYAASMVQRLRQLDYRGNNIGWGMDWIAICHAYSQGLEVLREDGLMVTHPRSRGYDTREATRQWLAFMAQMDGAEQSMFEILKRYTAEKKKGPLAKLQQSLAGRWARRGSMRRR